MLREHIEPTTLVVLVNLGTPASATVRGVRKFLRPFLSDRRVIDLPRLVWYPILYGIVLTIRTRQLVRTYESVWVKTESEVGESPLAYYCRRLRDKFQASLSSRPDIKVGLAMTYGENTINECLTEAHRAHPSLRQVVVLPLFPQYSSTTTACVFDAFFRFYSNSLVRCIPGLVLIRDYAENAQYVAALGNSILLSLADYVRSANYPNIEAFVNDAGDDLVIILSYHSIPVRFGNEGDDYKHRCRATTQHVAAFLDAQSCLPLSRSTVQVFQSHSGREPWLEPFFSDAVAILPSAADPEKKKRLAEALQLPDFATRTPTCCFVVTPGFAADCIETIHEIAEEGAEIFYRAGGRNFTYIPALNDSDDHVGVLRSVLQSHLPHND